MHRFRLAALAGSLILFATPALSQDPNFLQSAPACAQGCANLINVNTGCTPAGGAAVTNVQTYKGCFCDTANAPLNGAPSTYCVDTCPAPNQYAQMQKWFNGFCNFDKASTSPTQTLASPGSTTVSSMTSTAPPRTRHRFTSTGPGSPGATSTGAIGPAASDRPFGDANPNQTWWQGHYQWIVMVIVLIIGFSIIIAAGIYLKRRYDSKHNSTTEAPSNTAWAPNTTQFRSSSVYGDEPGHSVFSRDKSGTSSTAGRSWPT